MREPPSDAEVFGVLAEFPSAQALVDGVTRVRREGFRSIDAFSPFPIRALAEALDFHDGRLPWLCLGGGILGAALGYGMQLYTVHAYPIPIGNRPLHAPPAFLLITFELAVLGAVAAAIFGMLLLNRLPRLHHPVFDGRRFGFASGDRFFLVVFSNDARFDETDTRAFLSGLGARHVEVLRRAEPPA